MTLKAGNDSFVHAVSQKADAEGKPLPIWYWRVQRGGMTVAFGERRSEAEAMSAARAAEQNYGSGLKAGQSDQS